MKKITIDYFQKLKTTNTKFATITAYDYTSALLVDKAKIPLILVGDSAAMVVFGYKNTIPISMNEMIFLVSSVTRGAKRSLIVADMPFLSYQVSVKDALHNAGQFIKKAGAQAVKLEGGSESIEKIKAITGIGIPVVAHIGLTPQSFHQMSGYKIQGKTNDSAKKLLDDAFSVEQAGAFALVLEGIPVELAKLITNNISIPTIGIGAGPHCDGQIQVFHDIMGLCGTFVPKHSTQYANIENNFFNALVSYKNDVETKRFPQEKHSIPLDKSVLKSIQNNL